MMKPNDESKVPDILANPLTATILIVSVILGESIPFGETRLTGLSERMTPAPLALRGALSAYLMISIRIFGLISV
jgi:hypothetical protein